MTPRTARLGVLAFAVLSAMVVVATRSRNAELSNDGIQYVEGARRLLAGHGYSTGILYFDEHYLPGTLPAPQTVWPPGMSVGIAAIMALGAEPEPAGRILAGLSFLFLAPLVYLIGLRLTASPVLAGLAATWQLGMTEYWMYLTSPNSELPFIALALGALVLVPAGDSDQRRWLPAALLAGLATTFRYAGFFFLMAIGLVLLADALQAWRRERRLPYRAWLFALPGYALAGLLLLRNRMLVGDLRGGNTRTVTQPLEALVLETVRAFGDVIGGVTRSDVAAGGVAGALSVAGLAGLVLAAGGVLRGLWLRARGTRPQTSTLRFAGVAAIYAATYVVAMVFTSSRSMLTYGPRYLLPAIPTMICLGVFLAAGVRRPVEGPS